ncbi:heterodisulfide reductase subunit A [Desulfobacter hydrogenophilus]|uniref:FAD-dependent oxidoreductase n=1 Tax=Desulfobacter hydrogenophilus TaxID=2291 RepID=A0A328FBU8_9BACT|nr:FAD-dependent oxidoreductase [Desulfobacter hydrogenophilus]NDY71957.1 FAD-dependent oxidoreductase [Desulfobacter hydrogenophilus]QBH12351.1 FAD-dependent oxidoreductase [Desulfobacter hydrogenophilus]RAM02048.1 heterodisulfide reductase subunit A [Desulfobacter hydrogenophilus]
MDKKYGVYICTGCGIGDKLDIEALTGIPDEEGTNCTTHPFLCSKAGVALIQKDIDEGKVNAMVIGACSRRVNFDVFNFPGCIIERANLREGVVWPHSRETYPALTEDQKDDGEHFDRIQMKAQDYIKMGMIRLEKVNLPEPYQTQSFSKKVLVIGGGVTGMSAALDAAKAGYEVTIVEKEAAIGGYAAKLRNQMPVQPPFETLQAPVVDALIQEVEANTNIDVRTNCLVARIAGQPGEFTVTMKKPGEKIPFDVPFPLPPEELLDENGKELDADAAHEKYLKYNEGREDILSLDPNGELYGAVVLAAGWRPDVLEGEAYAHLSVDSPDVVTNDEFEMIAAKGKILRPSDGKEAKNVVFIQSAGKDEDDSDFEYTGSVTSMVALKQARYVREDYADGKAYVIYQHMRTPGLQEYFYKAMQQDDGIFMTKGAVTDVTAMSSELMVTAKNTLLGDSLVLKADMVVVASGMVPATKDNPVINLAYRQGPGFRDNDIFGQYADSNYICFPYETQRTGIYAAGTVRRAMTIEESMEDATGAALKAIQCIESANRGMAVHPRSGDMTFPEFFFQRCTQCKRCTVECPFGALDDDARGTPKANPTRCRRCGTCMGACPERIISFADYTIDSIGSQVKAISVPSEDDYDEPPLRFLALVCENDAYPALDMVGMNRVDYSPDVRMIPVRCLGSVNTIWIKDALAQGIDGVILIGCKHGDDYQCHFVKGSELAEIRVKKIGDALASLALEEERVAFVEVAIDEYDKLPQIINDFVEEVDALGPNPFKGF